MFSQLWFWLYVVSDILACTTPKTNTLGGILNMIALIAKLVFVILMFFFAPHWSWGLMLIAVYFITTMLTPKVDPNNLSTAGLAYSVIGSFINPFLVLAIYLLFFR